MTSFCAIPAALLAAVMGLAADQAQAQTLQKVAQTGQITVGYREASVPFSYLIAPDRPVGFAVELTEAIVDDVRKRTGLPQLKVVYTPVNGQNRIPLLVNGSYDLECGSTTHTAAREKEVAFAISHFYAGTRLLTRAQGGVRGFDDLAGKTVSTVGASTNEKVLRKHLEDRKIDAQVLLGKDYADTLAQLESGQAQAVALDDILLFGLRANASDPQALAVVGQTLQVEPYACMVRRDDPEFKRLVDDTLARLMRSGQFQRLYARWFESPIPPKGANLQMPMSAQLKANLQALSDQPAQ